ncbi:HAD-IB family phosphatase [Sandarakinorhabdus sp. AAP62]|uniref:HAD family hydrolase n=1 Tax=Sandarakinorhabdus sp. AAP62 TaxID=1248916 RepID=UPI0003652642|nr:HAD-IB family phosphatase [Sandarakinorhabdus sp. AAP62]
MTSTPTEIAVYDLDRTLTDTGSWAHFIRFWLAHEAPWRVLLLPMVALGGVAYGLGWLSRGQIKRWSHRWLIGPRVAEQRLLAVADAFAFDFVADHALAPARAAIAADAVAGRRVVIASASHGFYVRAIAERFGVADVVATEAVRDGGFVTHALDGANCYGAAKRAALERWLAGEGLAGAVVHFTSDHHSDLPCFELALASGGTVLCANPSARLAAFAAERGWPQVHWGRIRGSLLERA